MAQVQGEENGRLPVWDLVTNQEDCHNDQVEKYKNSFSGDDPPIDSGPFFDNQIEHSLSN